MTKLFGLSVLFIFCATVIFVPILIVLLSGYEGGFWLSIEQFILEFSGTLTSIGTLMLVLALALLSANMSIASAEKRERQNRRISAELKILEFRQACISELRNNFSKFHSVSYFNDSKDQAYILELLSKIRLLMNPNDEDYLEMLDAHKNLQAKKSGGEEYVAAIRVSQRILKREWDRLKADLKNVESDNA